MAPCRKRCGSSKDILENLDVYWCYLDVLIFENGYSMFDIMNG